MTTHRFLLAVPLLVACGGQPTLGSGQPDPASGRSASGAPAEPWTPPLGIPRPSFGVGEAAPALPSPWTAERAGFYCVNGETGTDSGRPNGTASAPRASIPKPVPAGAVIVIQGTYASNHTGGNNRIQCAGTAQSPVFIRGAAGAVVTGDWEISGSYCIIENLKFGPGGSWVILAPANHIAVRDNEFVGTLSGSGGIGIATWATGANASDIVLLRNNVHHGGDWQATFDQDSHGTGIYRSSDTVGTSATISNVWILDSEYSYNSGDGVQINGNRDSGQLHHVYLGRNTSHHNKQSGFGLKWASDVVFSENRVFNHLPSDSADGPGMGLQYDPQRVWYLFNESYNNKFGFWTGSGDGGGRSGVYYIGNVIHDNQAAGIVLNDWVEGEHVIGNTFYNNPIGLQNGYYRVGVEISNNIFSSSKTAHISFREYGAGAVSNLRNSLFDAPVRIVWDDVTRDVAGMRSIGECQGCRSGDPVFANAAGADFNLLAGSPGIDGGAVEAAYATYQQLYGIDIRKDRAGRARPQGAAWDIGAFEFVR